MRIAIVCTRDQWFIRRLLTSTQRISRTFGDTMVYHCDQHLGGPFATLDEAVAAAKLLGVI